MPNSSGEYQQGDRVRDTTGFFGAGIFERYDILGQVALVTWDRRPPRQYNMGENPCIIDPAKLAPENDEWPLTRQQIGIIKSMQRSLRIHTIDVRWKYYASNGPYAALERMGYLVRSETIPNQYGEYVGYSLSRKGKEYG